MPTDGTRKFSREMESIQAEDTRKKGSKAAGNLHLGVKGKLNNQEMEMLRQQLAKATAYDHTPDDRQRARQQQIKRPAQFVRAKKSGIYDQDIPRLHQNKPAKKAEATIRSQVDQLNRCEPQFIPHKTKGINAVDKELLQEEYASKPRKLSTIPLNLMEKEEKEDETKRGKRLAAPSIPQVFLL